MRIEAGDVLVDNGAVWVVLSVDEAEEWKSYLCLCVTSEIRSGWAVGTRTWFSEDALLLDVAFVVSS